MIAFACHIGFARGLAPRGPGAGASMKGVRCVLSRCLLSVLVVVAFAVHAEEVREDTTPICNLAGTTLPLTLSQVKTKLEFKCGSGLTALLPKSQKDQSQTEFCRDSSCTTKVSLGELNLKFEKAADKYGVTADELPDQPHTVYFVCAVDSQSDEKQGRSLSLRSAAAKDQRCVVQLSVYAKTPSTVQADNVCDGSKVTSVSLKVTEDLTPAVFGCGEGRALSPALFEKVLQRADGAETTQEVALQSLLPKATLTANSSGSSDVLGAAYTLTVPELPEAGPVKLGYKCAASKPAAGVEGAKDDVLDTSCTSAMSDTRILYGVANLWNEVLTCRPASAAAPTWIPSHAAEKQPLVKECVTSGSPLLFDITGQTPQTLQFKCKTDSTLLPSPQTRAALPTQFCRDSACKTKAALSDFNLELSGTETAYTFAAKTLPVTPHTVYFNCVPKNLNKNSEEVTGDDKSCVIQISVWGQTSSIVPAENVCTEKGKSVSLKVDKDLTPVTFGCGDKRTLTPVLLDQVFQPTETAASSPQPASLTSLVPTAALTANGSDKDAAKWHAYTLTVKELPEVAPVQLLYKCIATPTPTDRVREEQVGEQNKQPDCDVLIEVDQRPSTSGGSDSETGGGQRASLVAASAIVLASFPILSFIL
ncbi:hypothetical protein BESB_047450 [Besnoitia besnoiti]|uniref:SRS domain-containing protein n=1 Tax=Besnoitia besnoiti TaxID=94643 RepID=A0A2A9MLI0_BESBE|nr:hypothetical protein BESB_047450 [Besnoitia besnoiti]PFH36553.1 hypothetical protein BESB_047450 [Besnoitia besnoiti]